MRVRYRAAAVTAGLSLAMAGCSGVISDGDAAPQADATQDAAHTPEWTAGIIDQPRQGSQTVTVLGVRTAAHEGFDRTVFEFDAGVPGYHTEYIDRPVRKCGSGKATQVAGDGWLEVRMSPANAHTEEGQSTVNDRERMLNLAVLAELELTCDFEGIVTWVLGVHSPNRYQVRELSNPPRLVVDVRH